VVGVHVPEDPEAAAEGEGTEGEPAADDADGE
jgi:hypothetical protein